MCAILSQPTAESLSTLEVKGVAAAYRGLADGVRRLRFIPSLHHLSDTAPTP
jgi:hypothetical protein